MMEIHRRAGSLPKQRRDRGSPESVHKKRGQQSRSTEEALRMASMDDIWRTSVALRKGLWAPCFMFISLANFVNGILLILSLKILNTYYRKFRMIEKQCPEEKIPVKIAVCSSWCGLLCSLRLILPRLGLPRLLTWHPDLNPVPVSITSSW